MKVYELNYDQKLAYVNLEEKLNAALIRKEQAEEDVRRCNTEKSKFIEDVAKFLEPARQINGLAMDSSGRYLIIYF